MKSADHTVAGVPLVVDIDGTLIKSDLLHETLMQFLALHPLEAWRVPLWLLDGKARVKRELAQRVGLDVSHIPFRAETIVVVDDAHEEGRPVYLASASERGLVERLADRLGGIAGVFATDGDTNIAGDAKAARLVDAFGEKNFDYVGDRPVDFAVWQKARRVLAVSHGNGFARALRHRHPDAEIIASPRVRPRHALRAMRPYQWTKNLLIFLSLIAGHHFDPASIGRTILAFLCFCLAASGAYVLNDLLDLPGDRVHPRKRNRPLAAGDLPISHGVALSGVLMTVAIGIGAILGTAFFSILATYVVLTLAYSLVLKRKLLIDVIVLGCLYTIRVLAGVAAAGEARSQWLLMFSLFLFLGLATVKRCSELVARREAGTSNVPGRGYHTDDLAVLFPLAAAAGYGAVLIFALYLSSPEVMVLYRHQERLWLICPCLLYWMSRTLMLSSRNELHDDPVIFAITDRVSLLSGAIMAAIVLVSI